MPNPSFELYDTCPNGSNDLENAIPWFQPNNPNVTWWGSTDFFHTCGNSTAGVPANFAGYQWPRSGNGYAGLAPFIITTDNYGHEYMEVELLDSCHAGRRYCVTFYACFGGEPNFCLATSALGAYFSEDTCQYISWPAYPINVLPQAINDSSNMITDSLNWHPVSMAFISSGGERFMTIGNFWDSTYNQLHSLELCGPGAPYYFIDDVSVVMLPELNAGPNDTLLQGDTVALNGGVSEYWNGMQFEWLPHDGLVDPYSLNTSAHPDTTTTYTLTVTCPTCDVLCLDEEHDSVTLYVSAQPPLPPFRVPTLFVNDQFFQIENLQPNSRLKIYDVAGRLVYYSDNYHNDFGLYNFSPALYVYEIELSDAQIFTGKFEVQQR